MWISPCLEIIFNFVAFKALEKIYASQKIESRNFSSHPQDKTQNFIIYVWMGSLNTLLQTLKETTPVDTRRRFNVYKTSIRRKRRLIDVETKSCIYWDSNHNWSWISDITPFSTGNCKIHKKTFEKTPLREKCPNT